MQLLGFIALLMGKYCLGRDLDSDQSKKNYKITSVESKGKRAFKDTEQLLTFGYTAVFQLLHSESLLTTHIYK